MSFLKNVISRLFNKREKVKPNEFLKQTGECIVVDAVKLEIFNTIKYIDDAENTASREIQMLDGLIGRSSEDTKSLNVCYLIYNYEENGIRFKMVSPPIYKDRTTLLYLLDYEKKVSIYIDRTKNDNYYFDLDFIN